MLDRAAASFLMNAMTDEWGTVQALTRELDAGHADGMPFYSYIIHNSNPILSETLPFNQIGSGLAPQKKYNLTLADSIIIIRHLQHHHLGLKLHQYTAVNPHPDSIPLPTSCWQHHYVIIKSHRYLTSHTAANPRSSLVEVDVCGT
jgi:hypothetical protein